MYIDLSSVNILNISSETTGPFELKFHMKVQMVLGHMTKRAAHPMGQSFQDFEADFPWKVSLKMLN